MADLKVFYRRKGTLLSSDITLTVQHESIAYTIAEFESRNQDVVITHFLNKDNEWISVPPEKGRKQFGGLRKGETGLIVMGHVGHGSVTGMRHIIEKAESEGKKILVIDNAEDLTKLSKEALQQISMMQESRTLIALPEIELSKATHDLYFPRETKHREKKNWKSKTRKGR